MGIKSKLYITKYGSSYRPSVYIPVGLLRVLGIDVESGVFEVEIDIDKNKREIRIKL